MADWQRKLNLQPEWDKSAADEISIQEMAAVVAERLEKLEPFGIDSINIAKDCIVDQFRSIAEDEDADNDDFNWAMNDLYNWADIPLDNNWPPKKVCWVKTIV